MLCFYKNTRFDSHTHACQQLCCLAEMWERWQPLKHTVLIWNPVIRPYVCRNTQLASPFLITHNPTVVSPTPPQSFYLIQTSVVLTGFLQLTLASRSSWCSQKKPLPLNVRWCYPLKQHSLSDHEIREGVPPPPGRSLVASGEISWGTWISIWFGDDMEFHLKLCLSLFKSMFWRWFGRSDHRPSFKHLSSLNPLF